MKNIKRILSLIIVMALLLTMMAVPAMAKDSDTNETDIIGSLYLSATPTTITVRGATGSYSFRIDDSTTWTTNATFSGLYPNTEHTVYAKTGSAPEITVGKITTKAADYIANPNATSIDAAAPATSKLTYMHNISFQNSLSIFFVVLQSDLSGYENVRFFIQRMHYEENATECVYNDTIVPLSDCTTTSISGAKYYQFIYKNIAAAEMGETIYVTAYAEKDGITYVSPLDSCSVESYAYERLASSTNVKFKTMLVDLLNYGASAQVYFKRNVSHPVNAQLTSTQKALASTGVTASTLVSCDNSPAAASAASISQFNIQFMTTSNFMVLFKLDSSYNLSDCYFSGQYTTVKGVKKTIKIPASSFKKNGSSYYVSIDSISVPDMGCPISMDIYCGSQKLSNTKIYSMESYSIGRLQNSTDANYKDLILKLMRYSYSARAYFG